MDLDELQEYGQNICKCEDDIKDKYQSGAIKKIPALTVKKLYGRLIVFVDNCRRIFTGFSAFDETSMGYMKASMDMRNFISGYLLSHSDLTAKQLSKYAKTKLDSIKKASN